MEHVIINALSQMSSTFLIWEETKPAKLKLMFSLQF